MGIVKSAVLELAQLLPDDCTWDEAMYRLYVRQKVEAGIQDADQGRVIEHDELFREFEDEDRLDRNRR